MRYRSAPLARRWVPAGLALLACLAALLVPASTSAHPLGNFSVNRYTRIEPSRSQIVVFYVVDMAEVPTFQEKARIDANGDGALADGERATYVASQVTALSDQLRLVAGGARLALEPGEPQLEFLPGQGGLETLRMSVLFTAALPRADGAVAAEFFDDSFPGRLGWREIVVRAGPGVALLQSSAPAQDISQELRAYPEDLLQSPLATTQATFRFEPGAAASQPQAATAAQAAGEASTDQLAALIARPDLTPATLLVALLAAFGLGAAHALAPGHGKTVVAAYLVGSRGTARHALFLGLTTTVTHTAGVFALGLITLFVSQFVLPEQLYPWLGVLSGALVLTIGMSLFRARLRGWRRKAQAGRPASGGAHDHAGDDALDANGGHDHGYGYHTHAPAAAIGWRSLLALGVSGGLLPCPSALVLLLSAVALGRVELGLLLIVAFSLGLASVLTAIGVALVHAARLFERIPVRSRVFAALPVASALVICVVGAGITTQALAQALQVI